jgi:hypothetical protein
MSFLDRYNADAPIVARVKRTGDCWEWQGSLDTSGYGLIRVDGALWKTHRLMWTMFFGTIPKKLQVLHRCDNRKCVRPEHLFLGTQQDNMNDRDVKGRGHNPSGVEHPRAKLHAAQVADIRRRREAGESVTDLARAFGLSKTGISRVCLRRTYA